MSIDRVVHLRKGVTASEDAVDDGGILLLTCSGERAPCRGKQRFPLWRSGAIDLLMRVMMIRMFVGMDVGFALVRMDVTMDKVVPLQ